MLVYPLGPDLAFPSPERARRDGLLAVGGDLSPERILLAYSMGIFPWYSEDSPILWWSPDPRMVLFPDEFVCSKRLGRTIRQGRFEVRFDTAFHEVIRRCSTVPRPGQDGTWITGDMLDAYVELHRLGFAHSVETWREDRLVGGMYGISLGGMFFGESMFRLERDASKVALAALVDRARAWEFSLIDCQMHTEHLASLGAREISRREFLGRLSENTRCETHMGPWG